MNVYNLQGAVIMSISIKRICWMNVYNLQGAVICPLVFEGYWVMHI